MAIELVPLCTLTVQLKPPITIEGGPAGTRMIFEVASGDAEGEGFKAALKGQSTADWLVVGRTERARWTCERHSKPTTGR